jgi:hypothetical protein
MDRAFLLAVLIVLTPFFVAGAWMASAQAEYLRRYRESRGIKVGLPHPLVTSWYSFVDFHLLWRRQTDSEVESARRTALFRLYLTIVIVIVSTIVWRLLSQLLE